MNSISYSLTVLLFSMVFVAGINGSVQQNDWKDLLLTGQEKNLLDRLKQNVADRLPEEFMKSDFYLIRFLRARNLNLRGAEEMVLENGRWRKDNKIKDILKEDFSDVSDDFPTTVDGIDKQGRPILSLEMVDWDLRSAVLQGRTQRVLRYMDYFLETTLQKILDAQQREGKNVTRARVLIDAENLNLRQHLCPSCLPIFFRLVFRVESNYPGFWEEITSINAPSVSRVLVDFVKPVLSSQSRDLLNIMDGNKNRWMQYLDERIDRDQRISNYGGTMKSARD